MPDGDELGFLTRIPAAASAAEAAVEIGRAAQRQGTPFWFIGGVVPPGHPILPSFRHHNWPAGWRDRYERLVREILEAGVAAGEIRDIDVPVAGRMILGAVNWMSRWYDPKGALPATDIALRFCDMVLGGILAPAKRTTRRSAPRTAQPA